MNWRAAIPNALTLGNLACGVLAILALSFIDSRGKYFTAGVFVSVAAVFDVLDGAVARRLRTNSALGAQLDSLADVVSFGVVPTVMTITLFHGQWGWTFLAVFIEFGWRAYIFILPVYILLTASALAAAYRLARFNIEQQSSGLHYFEGLPTPASGLLVAGCCIMAVSVFPEKLLYNPEVHGMPVLLGFFCTLAMVSRWPFLSFKGSTREKLALVAVFAAGALLAWLTDWQPWVVLATLALYTVVSRVLIPPVRRAAQ